MKFCSILWCRTNRWCTSSSLCTINSSNHNQEGRVLLNSSNSCNVLRHRQISHSARVLMRHCGSASLPMVSFRDQQSSFLNVKTVAHSSFRVHIVSSTCGIYWPDSVSLLTCTFHFRHASAVIPASHHEMQDPTCSFVCRNLHWKDMHLTLEYLMLSGFGAEQITSAQAIGPTENQMT